MQKPFSNVRILDFTRFYAGPFGTYQFALLGAEVIKIEPLDGEEYRQAQLSKTWAERKLAPAFAAVNANKRFMALNLHDEEAKKIVYRLTETADIVWENFRPGVMERLGFSYEVLSQINPQLIYCAVSGFGQTGPLSREAAFDGKIQAMSGIMSMTGEPEQGPMRAGFAVCDLIGGLTAAFAVSSALYQRTQTGKGQFVDVALLDATLNVLAQHVTEYAWTGHVQRQYGNLSVTRKVTADRFRCGDGYIVLAVLLEKQFSNLMRVLGREDVLHDPRFKDWNTRTQHAKELRQIIEDAMQEGTPQDWEQRLTAADVPCSTVYSIDQIVAHPQVVARKIIQSVDSPYGPLQFVGPGFKLAHGSGEVTSPASRVGEHTADILREIGYSEEEIESLKQLQVIAT